jgi:hypothetical protein
MATRIYGVSRGEQYNQVTEGVGTAVASDSVELTVDLAANLTREDVLLALEKFNMHIVNGNWPPA